MNIVYVAAGAAGTYCGVCARDAAVVRGLIARGHDVLMLPLYTPLRIEGPDPSYDRVFLGGLNVYLQEKFAVFRGRAGVALDRILDHPALLRWVARMAVETRASRLGAMTVSVLQGGNGRQRREMDKLLRFLKERPVPAVVNLTNELLSGLAPVLKRELGCSVVCNLQGGEGFIQDLGAPYSEQARACVRDNAASIDLFTAGYGRYADEAADLYGIDRARVRVVPPGVDPTPYPASAQDRSARDGLFTVGFLSRMTPAKGIDLLADAVERLAAQLRPRRCRLLAGGDDATSDRALVRRLATRLRGAGIDVDIRPGIDLAGKVRLLHDSDAFSVPSRIAERRGMACLEAMACGVPVVLPDRGIFPELVARTGGGIVVPADDPTALAEALAVLACDPERCRALGQAAAAGVRESFSMDAATAATLRVYDEVI
jgi:glycosyltransferase involved in cell wall biosynthesis